MFEHRLRILVAIIGVGFLILAGRLFYLQVICRDFYSAKAAANIAFTEPLPTLRGVIYDRNGVELATNQVEYDVRVWLDRFQRLSEKDRDRWIRLVAESLQTTPGEVQAAVARAEQTAVDIANQRETPEQQQTDLSYIRVYLPQPIFFNVPKSTVIRVETDEFRLPLYVRGRRSFPVIDISDDTRRVYPCGSVASNLLGYMNRVTEKEYRDFREEYEGSHLKAYRMDELIGREGLEKYCNRELRGSRGQRMGVKDVYGTVQKELEVLPPVCGSDVRISIDARLQQLVELALDGRLRELERDGLGHNGGAAVIMDSNTGDILACATAPRYDPNTILDDFARLQADRKAAPLFDRSLRGRFPLGSVFKVVVALAGLESRAITGSTEFTCSSVFVVEGRPWRCTRPHGTLRLEQALEQSCNVWFYQAGLAIGGRRIHDMATLMGLGMSTGVGLPEASGWVPLPSSQAELINLSIGGGNLLVTPVQATRIMCALANSGKLPRPRLDLTRPVEITHLAIDPINLKTVRWGMYDVVQGALGTARETGRVPGLEYAAKTGTANLSQANLYDAWYCGFAPFRSPRLAFAAVIERTHEYGGQAAAPLIRDVFNSMLADPQLRKYLAQDASSMPDQPANGE